MAKGDNSPTLKDVYDVVSRLEDKVDTRFNNLEDRVDRLENWRWYIMGSIAVVVAVVWYFANEIKTRLIR